MDRDLKRLVARIERRYQIGKVRVEAAGRSFEIAKVAEPDSVFHEAMYDEKKSPGQPLAWQPYWAQAWESSVALAQYLAERNPQGRRVLDLGCGVGVVAAVAAGFGAHALAADIAQPGLLFSQLNVWPYRDRAAVRRMDWSKDFLRARFDWIACADIVYDRRDWPDLDRFWRHHLAPGGEVIISEPSRISGKEFRSQIIERGWNLIPVPGIRRTGQRDVLITILRPSG